MNEIKPVHHRFENPNGAELHHGHRPYWKRAHRDWVFWVGLFLMLSAAVIYVMSDNLALLPGIRPQHVPAAAVER